MLLAAHVLDKIMSGFSGVYLHNFDDLYSSPAVIINSEESIASKIHCVVFHCGKR